jgi:hypothetical protein
MQGNPVEARNRIQPRVRLAGLALVSNDLARNEAS